MATAHVAACRTAILTQEQTASTCQIQLVTLRLCATNDGAPAAAGFQLFGATPRSQLSRVLPQRINLRHSIIRLAPAAGGHRAQSREAGRLSTMPEGRHRQSASGPHTCSMGRVSLAAGANPTAVSGKQCGQLAFHSSRAAKIELGSHRLVTYGPNT